MEGEREEWVKRIMERERNIKKEKGKKRGERE